MADNIVQITIDGKDDTGPAFTSADAREKAFARAIDQSYRTQETSLRRVTQAESAHTRATNLLADAEALLADEGNRVESTHSRLGGIFSRLGGGVSGLGTAFASLGSSLAAPLAGLPLVGSAIAALGAAGALAWPVLLALAAALAAILVSIGPLVAGLGVITVGVAAFAAGAVGEIKKVITAHQQLAAAQAAYEKATTSAGKASALKAERTATEDLTRSEKNLLSMLDQVGGAFGKLEKAVRPTVVTAFGTAIKILKDLMPALTPLAVAAGKALDGFLKGIDNWLQGASGKKFITWMETEGPKALATFGHAMTDLVHGIGIVLYWWDRLGNDVIKFVKSNAPAVEHAFANIVHAGGNVVHAIENVIHAVGNTVHAFGNVVHAGGNVVHAIENVIHAVGNVVHAFGNVDHAASNVGHAADNVSHAFGNMMHAAGNVANAIGNIVSAISGAIGWFSRLASAANSALGGIPGKILGALGFAAGGIVGAASGGPRAGLTLVGERGPELVRLPAGSHVYSNSQSQQMAAAGGGTVSNYYFSFPNYVGDKNDLVRALDDLRRAGRLPR